MARDIPEQSFFFLHVDSLCRSPAITCEPDISVVEASRLMKENNITGLIVATGDYPVGIISVRDLRDLIVSQNGALGGFKVRDIMNADLITVRNRAYVFEAIFKMARNNIHRLAVVDNEKKLVGIITDTDLLSLQTRSPIYLTRELEGAESIEELQQINSRILDMVSYAMRSGADTKSLVHLISHFNDTVTTCIIALLERLEGIGLPQGASYLALGSEGRGEQTLRTDQDSAMVYADHLTTNQLAEIERFAVRLVDALEQVGVPRCPGNTMASNPLWRCSLSEWKNRLEQWITVPTGQNMVNFGMFQDFRTIHGDPMLEMQLHEHISALTTRNSLFFPSVAKNIVRFPPPLGMFGRIRVERRGKERGKLNLKRAGIFAITEGVSLLALEQGLIHGTTWEKLEELGKMKILSANVCQNIDESFTHLVKLRLQRQLQDLSAGKTPSNYIDPLHMTDKDRAQFREALRGVGSFLRLIRDRYKLDFISR